MPLLRPAMACCVVLQAGAPMRPQSFITFCLPRIAFTWNAAQRPALAFCVGCSLRMSPHAGSGSLSSFTPKGPGLSVGLNVCTPRRYLPHGQEARTAAKADGLERLQDRQKGHVARKAKIRL
jgi:hypothetical protein